jgi:molecular chaperone Hsp33
VTEVSTPAVEGGDTLHRFLLHAAPVRGELVSLDASWREVANRHLFPRSVRDRLGELCAAGLLLSASLKFDGALILQIHGDGPVALLVVECEADGRFRATAKLRDGQQCPEEADLGTLVNANGRGRFVVTLDPRSDAPERQTYQGIVPFEGRTVAEVLERYMARSEQVPTRLWLAADDARATGLLLQRLPDEGGRSPQPTPHDEDGWNRMQHLGETLTRDELLALPPQGLLHRLFWQETLHAFDSRSPRFACTCSRRKVAEMLRMLGRSELEDILAEQGSVAVRCEFCNTPYDFDAVDSASLFLSEPGPPGSPSTH